MTAPLREELPRRLPSTGANAERATTVGGRDPRPARELAGLLNYANYAELSLRDKDGRVQRPDASFASPRPGGGAQQTDRRHEPGQLRACTPPSRGCTRIAELGRGYAKLRGASSGSNPRRCVLLPGGQGAFGPVRAIVRAPPASRSADCTISNTGTPTYACSDPREQQSTSALLRRPLCPRP